MAMRLSGLMSGMDTDTIIQELVSVKRTKLNNTIKAQTKLEWKQTAWKDLNSKLAKLYNNTLSNLRFESAYKKKTVKSSNSSVSVIAGENAVNSVQSLKVDKLASSTYLTGGELKGESNYTATSKLTSSLEDGGLGLTAGSKISIDVAGKETVIEITDSTTIGSFVTSLQNAGVNASFDEKNQRFFISSKGTGSSETFELRGTKIGRAHV